MKNGNLEKDRWPDTQFQGEGYPYCTFWGNQTQSEVAQGKGSFGITNERSRRRFFGLQKGRGVEGKGGEQRIAQSQKDHEAGGQGSGTEIDEKLGQPQ